MVIQGWDWNSLHILLMCILMQICCCLWLWIKFWSCLCLCQESYWLSYYCFGLSSGLGLKLQTMTALPTIGTEMNEFFCSLLLRAISCYWYSIGDWKNSWSWYKGYGFYACVYSYRQCWSPCFSRNSFTTVYLGKQILCYWSCLVLRGSSQTRD